MNLVDNVRGFRPVPEYGPADHLFLKIGSLSASMRAENPDFSRRRRAVTALGMFGVAEDLVASGVKLPVSVFAPEGLGAADNLLQAFPQLVERERSGNFNIVRYPEPVGVVKNFIRDDFLSARYGGKTSPVLSGLDPHNIRDIKIVTGWGDTVGGRNRYIPMYFEGGNIVAGKEVCATTYETVRKNTLILRAAAPAIADDAVSEALCNKFGLEVIDRRLPPDRRLSVFHLDLALTVLPGGNGETAYVGSMQLARNILNMNGIKTDKPVEDEAWGEAGRLEFMSGERAERIRKAVELSGEPESVALGAISTSDSNFEKIGRRVHHFFSNRNYGTVEPYLDHIADCYQRKGFAIERVPVLLWRNEDDGFKIVTDQGPVYSPNPLVLNQQGDLVVYYGGGVGLFDAQVEASFKRRSGLTTSRVPSAMHFADSQAGLHCLTYQRNT